MTGRVWKFGDNVDTDLIIPSRYLVSSDPEELARHCMAGMDPEFATRVQAGDIIVGGENFGCGSSREHAPLAIKAAGVGCVIAKSFARIFYRTAFNIGLVTLECADTDRIKTGDRLEVDANAGEIVHVETGAVLKASRVPPFMQQLIQDGGLIPHVMKNVRERARAVVGEQEE